jgi:hypothetical protein
LYGAFPFSKASLGFVAMPALTEQHKFELSWIIECTTEKVFKFDTKVS